jgi:hypothetical protein
MRYVILQKTPFPGYWQPMPTYQLQAAECALRMGSYYHERAERVGSWVNPLYLYTLEDAIQIIAYWQGKRAWAAFKVLGKV